MRSLLTCCCLVALVGCGAKPEQQAAKDTTAAAMGAGAAPTAISLAAVAGKWTMHTMMAGSDSVLLTFDIEATSSPTGWTYNFPGRPPIPVRVVAIEGDSIVTEAGPYESMLRKGVQVNTRSVMRLLDGRLVGSTVAHYSSGPDTVLTLRTEGNRAP